MPMRKETAKERAAREADAARAKEMFAAELIAAVSEHRKAKEKARELYQHCEPQLGSQTLKMLYNAIVVEVMLRMRVSGMVAALPAEEAELCIAAGEAK